MLEFGIVETVAAFTAVALTWLIIVLGVVKVAKIFTEIKRFNKDFHVVQHTFISNLQKIQATQTELLLEQRRTSRLISELNDLKKAEMTGEFEIVEEMVEVAVPQINK